RRAPVLPFAGARGVPEHRRARRPPPLRRHGRAVRARHRAPREGDRAARRASAAANVSTTAAHRDRLVLAVALAVAVGHLAIVPPYGFFRDELYFIDCGRHPAFGYVDQPPLVPLLAAATQAFGTSLLLLRALAGLAHGALVLVTAALAGLIAEEVGA